MLSGDIPNNLLLGVTAAVFDFDGTLVDSHDAWAAVDQDLFDTLGLKQPPNYLSAIAGLRLPEIADYIIKHFNLVDVTQEMIISQWEKCYMRAFSTSVEFIEGAAEFLEFLASRSIPIGIATVSTHKIVETFFSKHPKIRGLIKSIVTSEDVIHTKPAPDVFLKCFENLGVHPSEGIIFEDSIVGLTAALRTGSKVVCVLSHPDAHCEKKRLSQYQIRSYFESSCLSHTLAES